jgi:hypothetical protein
LKIEEGEAIITSVLRTFREREDYRR